MSSLPPATTWGRSGALLAINLLYLMVWGFTGLGKLHAGGVPAWIADKFGGTFLAQFPGLTLTYWTLAVSEVLAFALALVALVRLEFLGRKPAPFLTAAGVWSLFVFVQLGFGQWLTSDFTATFQLFTYFAGTLVTVQFILSPGAPAPRG